MPTICVVVYLSLGHAFDFKLALMRGLSLGLVVVLGLTIRHLERRGQASAIDAAMFGYLILSGIGFWFWPTGLGRSMAAWPEAALYVVLLLSVALPPLFGREPFTYHFARRRAPEAVWETDVFKRINRNMTAVWAGTFLVCTLSALVPALTGLGASGWAWFFTMILPAAVLIAFGWPFTQRYPDHYQRKLGLAPVQAAAAPEMRQSDTGGEAMTRTPGGAASAKTCKELLEMMPLGLDSAAAGDMKAVYQFEVGEPENFTGHLVIEDGRARYLDGPAEKPDVTIKTPPDVWLGVAKGEINGQEAFMSGRFIAQGDLGLLMKLGGLFKG